MILGTATLARPALLNGPTGRFGGQRKRLTSMVGHGPSVSSPRRMPNGMGLAASETKRLWGSLLKTVTASRPSKAPAASEGSKAKPARRRRGRLGEPAPTVAGGLRPNHFP